MSISSAIATIEARAALLSCPVHFSGALVEKPEPAAPFALVEVNIGTGSVAAVGQGGALMRYEGTLDVSLFAPHDARAALLALMDEAVGMFPSGLTLGDGVLFLGRGQSIGRVETAEGDIGWLVCEVSIRFTVDQ